MENQTLHNVLLSIHLLGAFILLTGIGMISLTMIGLRRARTGEGLRHALFAGRFIERVMPVGVVFILFGGIWLAFLKDPDYDWHSAWIITAFILVLVFTVNGVVHMGAKMEKLAKTAGQVDGGLSPKVIAMCNDPALHASAWIAVGVVFSFIILMTDKPNWLGSILTVALGASAGLTANWLAAKTANPAGRAPQKSNS